MISSPSFGATQDKEPNSPGHGNNTINPLIIMQRFEFKSSHAPRSSRHRAVRQTRASDGTSGSDDRSTTYTTEKTGRTANTDRAEHRT